jgi:hypothetical protein
MIPILTALLLSSPGAESTSLVQPDAALAARDDGKDRPPPEAQFYGKTTEQLELQLAENRRHHDSVHLLPPLLVLAGGAALFVGGVLVLANYHCPGGDSGGMCSGSLEGGLVMGGSGLLAGFVGIIWLVVDAIIRGSLNSKADLLETEIAARKASATSGSLRLRIAPWTNAGASGLALTLSL